MKATRPVQHETPKTKVLYIMGEGRSGSTILDQVLGTHSDIWGAGELWSFFSEKKELTGACSCGRNVDDCFFWREVKNRYLKEREYESLSHSNDLRKTLDSVGTFFKRLLGVHIPGLTEYENDSEAIYKIIGDVTDNSIIVDSTKQIGRGYNLLKINNLNVFVIHLIRDGRGVVWSRIRDKQRNPGIWRHGPYHSVLNWVVKNTLGMLIGYFHPEKYIKVKYEDLIRDPTLQLQRIGKNCGINFSDVNTELKTSKLIKNGHEIGGNVRARTTDSLRTLKLDEEWKNALPRRYNLFYLLIAWLPSKFLGY